MGDEEEPEASTPQVLDLAWIVERERVAKQLTFDAFAEASGVPKPTLYKIARGQTKRPGSDTLNAIAAALELPASMLFAAVAAGDRAAVYGEAGVDPHRAAAVAALTELDDEDLEIAAQMIYSLRRRARGKN